MDCEAEQRPDPTPNCTPTAVERARRLDVSFRAAATVGRTTDLGAFLTPAVAYAPDCFPRYFMRPVRSSRAANRQTISVSATTGIPIAAVAVKNFT